jgi:hypothetical protein
MEEDRMPNLVLGNRALMLTVEDQIPYKMPHWSGDQPLQEKVPETHRDKIKMHKTELKT